MQANPDNDWIQIESMRLVGFEFKARKATVGGINNTIVRTQNLEEFLTKGPEIRGENAGITGKKRGK